MFGNVFFSCNPLPPELCHKARATELEYFKDKELWTLRKVSEALRRQGKLSITVRVD